MNASPAVLVIHLPGTCFTMRWIVAYDIAHPRRLRRVARRLERQAIRCQKSVFLFRGDETAVQALLDGLVPLLKLDEDCVQVWRLTKGQPSSGLWRGQRAVIRPAVAIVDHGDTVFIEEPKS